MNIRHNLITSAGLSLLAIVLVAGLGHAFAAMKPPTLDQFRTGEADANG